MPITRQALAKLDIEALLLDEKFLRFLSTVRSAAGIETVAYGPDSRHLHFAEGRRSLWCDMLRSAEIAQPEALLLILQAELKASKETSSGRRKYNRLDSDDGSSDGSSRDGDRNDGLPGYLDYGEDGSSSES